MLTEERFHKILSVLNEKKAVTVNELVALLNTSESTIRRDLNALANLGKLNKVHGGAVVVDKNLTTEEKDVKTKHDLNREDKISIAKFSASLIEKGDFVYIDAGTTTEILAEYIQEKEATYVTNGIVHAKKLIEKGCTVYILGGELKLSTEAIIGVEAIKSLKKYNFTKAFFGSNGVSIESGFTTPDVKEALVKEEAINRSKTPYVLVDNSKFNKIFPITFAEINRAKIITKEIGENKYKNYTEVLEV